MRPSSAWFTDRLTKDKEVSVTLEKDLLSHGGCIDDALNLENINHNNFGLASCNVGFLKACSPEQSTSMDPTNDDPYHALVVGEKKKSLKNKIAKHANVLIEPNMTE